MFYACTVTLIIGIVGCRLTSIHVPNAGSCAIGVLLLLAMVLPFPLYLKEKGKLYLRDSLLTILWALLLYGILNLPVSVAARLGMGIGLQDSNFAHLDQAIGVNVPSIMAWASNHWLGHLANESYGLLLPLMCTSVLLPTVAGKVKSAQRFLTANLLGFALGLPLFALLPAIGPWYGYHLAAGPDQAECQAALLLIRTSGPYVFQPAAFVCFPSFHVIWAILCVQALWGFRLLRIPVAGLSGLIIFSTMTTGWHYFFDVLGGILIAVVAMATAEWLSRAVYSTQPSDVITLSEEQPVSVIEVAPSSTPPPPLVGKAL
jgi:hypothetical protein